MKYFSLRHSLNNKIVGRTPQIIEALYSCDVWDDPKFIDHENVHFKRNYFGPITAKGILVNKAKLTDYVSAHIIGFSKKLLISSKLKNILHSTGKDGLQFYNSPIIFKGHEITDYWVLNPYEMDNASINYSESDVFLMRNTSKKVEKLCVLNYENFLTERERVFGMGYPFSIYIERPHILENVKEDFLILENVPGGVMYLVSESLKQKMEQEEVTGIEFMPPEMPLNEWLKNGGEREKLYGKA